MFVTKFSLASYTSLGVSANYLQKTFFSTKNPRFVPHSTLVLKADLKAYEIAHTLSANLLWVDLQDGVPLQKKPAARKLITHALETNIFKDNPVVVRINELTEPAELAQDLLSLEALILQKKICGLALPMLKGPSDVLYYEDLVRSMAKKAQAAIIDFQLFPIIETPLAVKNAFKIATASPWVSGLYLGKADLAAEMGVREMEDNCDYVLQQIALIAKAAGVFSIGGTYKEIDNPIGLEKQCLKAKLSGHDGFVAIHPSQLAIINKIFLPSQKDIKRAHLIRATLEKGFSTHQAQNQPERVFAANPDRKLIDKILNNPKTIPSISQGVKPKWIEGGIDLTSVSIGTPIDCEFELPITEGVLAQWDGFILNSRRITSSAHFARKLGFTDRLVPNSLLMTLTASLAVSRLSESAIVHLSFKNAQYLRPVYPGDSLSGRFTVISIQDSKSGKGSIVRSHHVLQNQRGEEVYQLEKWTLFPHLAEQDCFALTTDLVPSIAPLHQSLLSLPPHLIECQLQQNVSSRSKYAKGDVIVHRFVKGCGESIVTSLCNAIRAINHHHHDSQTLPAEKVLVPGPFTVHASLASAALDLGEVLYEQIHYCNNLNKVNHSDVIGAITYVKNIGPVPNNPNLENLRLVTLGLKNIDMKALSEELISIELFDSENAKLFQINSICEKNIPTLLSRVVCKTEYTITRILK